MKMCSVVWAYNIGKHQMTDEEYEQYILTAAEYIGKRR